MQSARAIIHFEMQSKRESAHLRGSLIGDFAIVSRFCTVRDATAAPNRHSVAICQHRYPSPDRSVPFADRPVSTFRSFIGKNRFDIGYQARLPLECGTANVHLSGVNTTRLGKVLCKRHQSLLPLRLFSVWLAAWIQTWNAALLAQAQVWSLLKFWTLIQPAQHWLALRSVFCVMTQASVVRHANNTPLGGIYNLKPPSGSAPVAVFCFEDGNICSRKY